MRRALLALVASSLAALAAGGAAAAPTASIKLQVGDAVDVLNTKVACFAINSNGKDGVACVLWKNGKPAVGTYGAGLAADGTAVVNKIGPGGTGIPVFKRKLMGRTYRVKVGDLFGMQLTDTVSLGCKVLKVTSTLVEPIYRGIKVSCYRATETAPLPNTYGVSISDKFAGVYRFDSQGRVTTWGFVKKQP